MLTPDDRARFNRCVRRARNVEDFPLLWAMNARQALVSMRGGFWRWIWSEVVWHIRLQWVCEYSPAALARRAWFWYHEHRGHFRYTEQACHWLTCPLPDDLPEDFADNCIDDAMPRWLRVE